MQRRYRGAILGDSWSPPQRFDQKKDTRENARRGCTAPPWATLGHPGYPGHPWRWAHPTVWKNFATPNDFFLNPISTHTNYVFKRNYLRGAAWRRGSKGQGWNFFFPLAFYFPSLSSSGFYSFFYISRWGGWLKTRTCNTDLWLQNVKWHRERHYSSRFLFSWNKNFPSRIPAAVSKKYSVKFTKSRFFCPFIKRVQSDRN